MTPESFMSSISSITPDCMSGYLCANGWVEFEIDDQISVWRIEGDNEFEILQPLKESLRDYRSRIFDALIILEKVERRSLELIASDILNFSADIIKIRIIHEDVESGSIPLDDGVALFEKARELLVSIVRSTFTKKRYFSGGKLPEEIGHYLSSMRLGQTEHGSYVVNLIAPIYTSESEQVDDFKSSLTRAVTNTLSKSLSAIAESIDEYKGSNNERAFDLAVEKGVSANFCDALVGIAGGSKARDFEIKISMSKKEHCLEEGLKLSHSFNANIFPFIEKASEYYKDNYVIEGKLISGHVVKLTHEHDAENGSITIDASVNGRNKHVTLDLSVQDYWKAYHAHKDHDVVEVVGDLYVSPKSAKLLNPQRFKIISSGDLFED